jgi:hypothetical protein
MPDLARHGVTMNRQFSQPKEVEMALRHRSLIVTLTFAALIGIGPGPVPAADSTHVDAATRQVELGAQQIGQGQVLVGAGGLAKGIGNTIVEGAKFTGQKLAEAGRAAGPDAKTAWERSKEGAVAFGSSVRDFFVDLFGG